MKKGPSHPVDVGFEQKKQADNLNFLMLSEISAEEALERESIPSMR